MYVLLLDWLVHVMFAFLLHVIYISGWINWQYTSWHMLCPCTSQGWELSADFSRCKVPILCVQQLFPLQTKPTNSIKCRKKHSILFTLYWILAKKCNHFMCTTVISTRKKPTRHNAKKKLCFVNVIYFGFLAQKCTKLHWFSSQFSKFQELAETGRGGEGIPSGLSNRSCLHGFATRTIFLLWPIAIPWPVDMLWPRTVLFLPEVLTGIEK